MTDPSVRERLRGAWRLESFVFTGEGGEPWHPLGREPAGFLFVTQDDYISFNFMAEGRRAFASDDLFAGRPDELAAAAQAVVSFAGPFRIEDATLVVDVQFSLFPNWIGKMQVRAFELDGDALILRTTGPIVFGGVFRRAEARLTRDTTR
jgi:hypothetical protein